MVTVSPRAPFGPSVVFTEGMPSRGKLAVRQVSIPTVTRGLLLERERLVRLAMSRGSAP